MAKKQAAQTEQTAAAQAAVYVFQHGGHEIEFNRGTVRTAIEARRIVQALLSAYGHVAGNPASDEDYDTFTEYAGAMARTKTSAAWHARSSMPDDVIRQKFEEFLNLDEAIYEDYRTAAAAFGVLKLAQATGG
jgi:hypothetical protein